MSAPAISGEAFSGPAVETAAHTPGPWNVSRNGMGELQPFSATGEHLLHGDSKIELEEREANAHLIEAAPDLAEALQSAVETLEQFVKLGRIPENTKGLRDARAALAKAGLR